MIDRKSFCHMIEFNLVALVTKVHFIFYFNDIIAVNIFSCKINYILMSLNNTLVFAKHFINRGTWLETCLHNYKVNKMKGAWMTRKIFNSLIIGTDTG